MATQAKNTTKATAGSRAKKAQSESQTPISDKMQDSLHESVDTLAGYSGKTEEKLRQSASSSAEAIAEKQKAAQDKWQQSSVRRYAAENPLTSAGIAFAAGMLLTSLLRRK